jgi:hypothetical protein
LKSSAEKEEVSLKNRIAQRKIQIVGGKRSRRPENQNFSRISGSVAENLKLHARSEKFRDFGGFPAILLNFRLTIRISSDRTEMPPTIPRKPLNTAIFRRTFDRRPAAEKILLKFYISSHSFVLATDKIRIRPPIF